MGTENESGEKPEYLVAAELRARLQGRQVEEILAEDKQRVLSEGVAVGDCLTPDAVEFAVTGAGELADRYLDHAECCRVCANLIAGARPSQRQVERFLDEASHLRDDAVPARTRRGSMARVAEWVLVPAILAAVTLAAGYALWDAFRGPNVNPVDVTAQRPEVAQLQAELATVNAQLVAANAEFLRLRQASQARFMSPTAEIDFDRIDGGRDESNAGVRQLVTDFVAAVGRMKGENWNYVLDVLPGDTRDPRRAPLLKALTEQLASVNEDLNTAAGKLEKLRAEMPRETQSRHR